METIALVGRNRCGRVLRGMLYGVDPLDPLVMLGAVLLLMATSLLAAFPPARRAAPVDPLVALRYE